MLHKRAEIVAPMQHPTSAITLDDTTFSWSVAVRNGRDPWPGCNTIARRIQDADVDSIYEACSFARTMYLRSNRGVIATSLLALLLNTGCHSGGATRLAPERVATITAARTELRRAAQANDLPAIQRLLAPGATLLVGRDTLDLRDAVARYGAELAGGRSTMWVVPKTPRMCERWAYESGGQAGFAIRDTAGSVTSQPRFRYAIAWTTGDRGEPLIQSLSIVPGDFGGTAPYIGGCRPSAKERQDQLRWAVAISPGLGLGYSGTTGDIEAAMRSRTMQVGGTPDPAGFEPALRTPVIGAAWYRVSRRLTLETITTLTVQSAATSGTDSAAGLVTASRLDQKWIGLLASARLGDLRVGVGPAITRQAWYIGISELDTNAAGSHIVGAGVATAGDKRNRIGLMAQTAVGAPINSRLFIEIRGFLLMFGGSTSPAAFSFAPVTAKTTSAGIGVTFGVAF